MTALPQSSPFTQDGYKLQNGVREALLQQGYGKALVIIECVYYLKIAGDTWWTRDQLFRLLNDNFGVSFRLVYEGLRQILVFQRRKAKNKRNQAGRPHYLYRIPYPEELKAEFAPDIVDTPHDPLKKEDLKTLHSYRLALHRELKVRLWLASGGKGFEMFRACFAERLGVSVRTTRTYDQILGHSNEANYKQREITWKNWNELPRYKNKYDIAGKRLPSPKWLEIYDYQTGEIQVLPHVRYLAYIALITGLQVYEVERTANTYYPYQKPQMERTSSWDVDYYFAEIEARNKAGFYQKQDGTWYRRE